MKTIFSWVAGSVITTPRVTSDPVPAVVGTQSSGSVRIDGELGTRQRRMSPSLCSIRLMALAVSMALPPPKPMKPSYDPAWKASAPASTAVMSGSGTVSEKTPNSIPALDSAAPQSLEHRC